MKRTNFNILDVVSLEDGVEISGEVDVRKFATTISNKTNPFLFLITQIIKIEGHAFVRVAWDIYDSCLLGSFEFVH